MSMTIRQQTQEQWLDATNPEPALLQALVALLARDRSVVELSAQDLENARANWELTIDTITGKGQVWKLSVNQVSSPTTLPISTLNMPCGRR